MNKFKVILPARYIPSNSIVTKINGTVKYRIWSSFNIYDEDGKKVNSVSSCFLVSLTGRNETNIIAPEHELIWEASIEELKEILDSL